MKEGSSPTCTTLSTSLEHLRDLKQAFDVAFEKALSSGTSQDQQEAQQSKEAFETGMKQLRTEISLSQKSFVETHTEQLLSSLVQKRESGDSLSKYELFVLYELHTTSVLLSEDLLAWRKARNHEKDLLVMFDDPAQIARSINQINESTKVYIGQLEPGFFDRLPKGVEHIYTDFPEKRIRRHHIEIGGKDEHQLQEMLTHKGHRFDYVKWMLEHEDFQRSLREEDLNQQDWKQWKLKSPEEITLIRLSVKDLGFPDGATTDQIFARAVELGLELCPPEVGPQFRLQYTNQPMNEYVYVGMKQISDSGGSGHVFSVERNGDGSWLDSGWGEPDNEWHAGAQFVFRLRK